MKSNTMLSCLPSLCHKAKSRQTSTNTEEVVAVAHTEKKTKIKSDKKHKGRNNTSKPVLLIL